MASTDTADEGRDESLADRAVRQGDDNRNARVDDSATPLAAGLTGAALGALAGGMAGGPPGAVAGAVAAGVGGAAIGAAQPSPGDPEEPRAYSDTALAGLASPYDDEGRPRGSHDIDNDGRQDRLHRSSTDEVVLDEATVEFLVIGMLNPP